MEQTWQLHYFVLSIGGLGNKTYRKLLVASRQKGRRSSQPPPVPLFNAGTLLYFFFFFLLYAGQLNALNKTPG